MKQHLRRIALLLSLVMAAPAAGQEARLTLDKIKELQAISLGYRTSSPPFSFLDKDKKPTGYSVELCLRIATAVQRKLGMKDLKVNWVAVTPSSRMPDLVEGAIDLECGSTTITFSRMARVDFSFLTFVDGAGVLATTASGIGSVSDLAGKRVAVIPGTTTEQALAAALQKALVGARVVEVGDHAEGLAGLENGTIDAYVSDRVLLGALRAKAKDPERLRLGAQTFSYEPYGLMMRRGDAPFRVEVNRALAALYRSGEIVRIYEKWFGPFGGANPLVQAVYLIQSLPE
jgi:glutamate/aspartate transport system substrate-binding protein